MRGWAVPLALALALAGTAAGAAGGLAGQPGVLEWHLPPLGAAGPLAAPEPALPLRRGFTMGSAVELREAAGIYPALTLRATGSALAFAFSEGWCCLAAGRDAFVGPVVTFPSLPEGQDLQVTLGESTLGLDAANVLVSGNRIAVDLRGRDIGGGHLTLLVALGPDAATRGRMALAGLGLVALGLLAVPLAGAQRRR